MIFQVPKGAKNAKPVALDGWTATQSGGKITFASDKVPDEEASFGITFTAPTTKTLLAWKVIQQCQDGVTRWIEGPKGENPAPLVGVGKTPARPWTRRSRDVGPLRTAATRPTQVQRRARRSFARFRRITVR